MKNPWVVLSILVLVVIIAALMRGDRHRSKPSDPGSLPSIPEPVPASSSSAELHLLRREIRDLRNELRAFREEFARRDETPVSPTPSTPARSHLTEFEAIQRFAKLNDSLWTMNFWGDPSKAAPGVSQVKPDATQELIRTRLEMAAEFLKIADVAGFKATVSRMAQGMKRLYNNPPAPEVWDQHVDAIFAPIDSFLDPKNVRHRYFKANLGFWIEDLFEQ